jgi:DNA (cytosine-5)-methyltransferase 1
MKAVELFAGIGGFRLACDELGIKTIWANDIDPKASRVYRDKFGSDIFVEGDISDFIEKIPPHDVLTGGFPCQPFSSAGKKIGIEDARGSLFEHIVTILKLRKPAFFVLENVKRLLSMDKGKHFATILNALSDIGYLVEWRLLNAVNFGLPQNRERVVIIGQLQDCSPKSFLCTKDDFSSLTPYQNSSIAHFTGWKKIEAHGAKFAKWGLSFNGKFCHQNLHIFSQKRKSVKLYQVMENNPDNKFFFTKDTLERLKYSEKVNKFINGVEILYNQKGGARMGYSIFGTEGVAPTLTRTTSRHYERYKIGNNFRRLTNIEYARIQGFPDSHCRSASLYDQYKLYGNSVPPEMVKWAIDRVTKNKFVPLEDLIRQRGLFDDIKSDVTRQSAAGLAVNC